MGAPKNTGEFARYFPEKLLMGFILGTELTYHIPNRRLHRKCGLVPLSRAVMRKIMTAIMTMMRSADEE